jgi:hypothetical protein
MLNEKMKMSLYSLSFLGTEGGQMCVDMGLQMARYLDLLPLVVSLIDQDHTFADLPQIVFYVLLRQGMLQILREGEEL